MTTIIQLNLISTAILVEEVLVFFNLFLGLSQTVPLPNFKANKHVILTFESRETILLQVILFLLLLAKSGAK